MQLRRGGPGRGQSEEIADGGLENRTREGSRNAYRNGFGEARPLITEIQSKPVLCILCIRSWTIDSRGKFRFGEAAVLAVNAHSLLHQVILPNVHFHTHTLC